MGVDFRDVFNKGLPSLWVTAIEKETFPLFVNLGAGQFADKTVNALRLQPAFQQRNLPKLRVALRRQLALRVGEQAVDIGVG